MSATLTAPGPIATPPIVDHEQRFHMNLIDWSQYLAISGALDDKAVVRLAYLDGGLTFMGTSFRHERFVECLGVLVTAIAASSGLSIEPAGHATLRREDRGAGVEGDKTFYLGPNALAMRGARNIDLTTQAPPDLAVEVEVSHPADKVMAIYGRLGIPEVWRFDVGAWTLKIWILGANGKYSEAARSVGLPILEPANILGQLRLFEEIGFSAWYAQLGGWARDVVIPPRDNGA